MKLWSAWSPAAFFEAGAVIGFMAQGDFNGDNAADLALPSWFDNQVGVVLGDGNGGFGPRNPLPVGSQPVSAAVGDWDRDGNNDLVAANFQSGDLSLVLGRGDGSFDPEQRIPLGPGPTSVAVGDLNGDGKPDLAVALSSGVAVLLNGGLPGPQAICSINPSSLNLQSNGNSFTLSTVLTDPSSGLVLDPALMSPAYLSRVSSPGIGDIVLPTPNAGPGCNDFTDDGLWETVASRTVTGSGTATLRFNTPSDGQCETRDGNRQDLIALLLDVPDGETASICYTSSYPGFFRPFECCAAAAITNHGNR